MKFSSSMRKIKSVSQPLGLPDSNDEHVIALALQEKADKIVTFNLKDFPKETLGRVELLSVHPDLFLCELYDSNPEFIIPVINQVITSYTKTKPSKVTYFESLRKAKVPMFVERLKGSGEAILEIWPPDSRDDN